MSTDFKGRLLTVLESQDGITNRGSFCLLHYNETQSATALQWVFQTQYHKKKTPT
jgi:hypothetical protein